MKEIAKGLSRFRVGAKMPHGLSQQVKAFGKWRARLYDSGVMLWEQEWSNLTTTEGRNYVIANGLTSGTWYIGLVDGTTPTFAVGNTMASHAGWAENTEYAEAARQEWVDGAVAAGSVDNSGSLATFTMNDAGNVAGAFLTTNSTKGGTTGTLYACGAFGTAQPYISGNVLTVEAVFGLADDGV